MVYIEIIYLLLYSVGCFFVVKKIYADKLVEIEDQYNNSLNELQNELGVLKEVLNEEILKARQKVVEENRSYLSSMKTDITHKLNELSDNIKNRPII
jgi:ribosomal protein L9